MEGVFPPGSERTVSLQKVVNERRRKRQQKSEAKRAEKRDKLMKQEVELKKLREAQASAQSAALKETEQKIAEVERQK